MALFTRKPQPGNAIVASARDVRVGDESAVTAIAAVRQPWQTHAWDLFYKLAEIHYPASYIGASLGRFTFPVGQIPKDDPTADATIPKKDERTDLYRAAEDIMFAFEGPLGGPSELARLYAMNMMIAADCWLTGRDHQGQPEWEVLSVNELKSEGGKFKRYSVSNARPDPEWAPQYVKRIWRASPERTQIADSAMSSLIADCQRLVALNESMTSRIVNRLIQAGLMVIPSEFSIETPAAPDGSGQANLDPFMLKFLNDAQQAMLNRDKPVIPTVIRGPAQYADAIRFVTMDRTIDRVEMELRSELRHNINTGIDLPPEVSEGMGGATHWSAWAIGDSAFAHLLPEAGRWADALTREYLWRGLRSWVEETRANFTEADIRHLVVLPDGSNVVVRPNAAEDGRQLRDRFAISDSALRLRSGAADEEKPTDEEYVRMLGQKINNAYLATYGLEVQGKIDWEKSKEVGSTAGAPGVGGTPPSRRPADSSDPAGAPGEGDTDAENESAADRTAITFAAAAAGFTLAATKKVGATVRALCEPHPDIFQEVKPFPNEKVLGQIDPVDIGLTEHRVRSMFVDELMGIVEVVDPSDRSDAIAYVGEVADFCASHADAPDHAKLLELARTVLSLPRI